MSELHRPLRPVTQPVLLAETPLTHRQRNFHQFVIINHRRALLGITETLVEQYLLIENDLTVMASCPS